MPANDWIELGNTSIPKMFSANFWYEGEVAFYLADTNLGKSILAVQIANSISRGEPIPAFKLEAGIQNCFDFELTDKQFKSLLQRLTNPISSPTIYFVSETNPESEVPDGSTFEDYLNQSIKHSIIETGPKYWLSITLLIYVRN